MNGVQWHILYKVTAVDWLHHLVSIMLLWQITWSWHIVTWYQPLHAQVTHTYVAGYQPIASAPPWSCKVHSVSRYQGMSSIAGGRSQCDSCDMETRMGHGTHLCDMWHPWHVVIWLTPGYHTLDGWVVAVQTWGYFLKQGTSLPSLQLQKEG